MKIQLTFEQPLIVSFETEPDILEIAFADEDLFISQDGIKLSPSNQVIRRELIK